MADPKNGSSQARDPETEGPDIASIEDPEFAEVITDDLAVSAGEGLHLTRDPENDRAKQHSEPGIRLSEIGVDAQSKKKAKPRPASRSGE